MVGGNKLNFKNDGDKNFSKVGISLITLVITIIVIVILAAIVLFASLTTVDNANYATFASEFDEINSGTQATLRNNILNGNSEAERNAGFTKVKVENAPGSFVSVSEDSISGYVVDLDTIKVSGTKTGKGEVIAETVTFGKDDVYVYDDEGKVYYAKGYNDSEGNLKYRLEEYDNISIQPTIASIDVVLNEAKTAVTVKVTAAAANGGALTVTGGGKTATKIDENLYQLEITRNGTIVVIVRETGGGSAMRTITISGIEKAKYTVTYDANGGAGAPEAQSAEEGTNLTISTQRPTWDSYHIFKGWSESSTATSASYQPGATYTKGTSTTLFAVWEGIKYTIAFDDNGGSGGPGSQQKEYDVVLTISDKTPTREGYIFKGWATSSSATSATYQPNSTYSANSASTLYAVWEAKTYTITYNANGGTGAPGNQTKKHGENLILSSTKPQKEGATFNGWAISSSGAVKYNAGDTYTDNAGATLYAVWSTKTYTITLNSIGSSSTLTKEHGKALTLTTPSAREGYEFLGWSESSSATSATYTSSYNQDKDVTLYAVWKAKTYTITLNDNYSSGTTTTVTQTHGVAITLPTRSRTGHTFLGWATSSSATTATYSANSSYTPNQTITLYGIWKINGYTVTYNANGGTGAPDSQLKTQGVSLTISTEVPTRPGYTFQGWGTSKTTTTVSYNPGSNYTQNKDITLYAVWKEDVYTISYDANGGTTSTAPSSHTKKYDQSGVTISSSKPSRRRYTFVGWSKAADSKEVVYQPGDSFTENTSVTLYAVWESSLIPSIANGPRLNTDEMVAVYWSDANASVEQTDTSFEIPNSGGLYNTTLYNYSMGDGVEDTKQTKWANAKTSDGSYWVWIPRYAYKLIYYTSSNRTIESSTKTAYGDVDILFMHGTSNTQYRNASGEAADLPEGYTVHPAFQAMNEDEITYGTNMLGKWNEELEGIWVAKYEASREISSDGTTWTATSGTNGKTTNAGNTSTTQSRVVSKPSVTSWRSIANKYIYQNCLKMNETLNTHQMKNSEWGAVAYLTYSPYGRNGNELAVNQCSSYYTGAGKNTGTNLVCESSYYSYSADTFDTTYAWNTDLGKLTSTTGNIYGIYDMSGGALEYTASYLNNGHDNLMTYGNDSTNSGYNLVDNSNKSVDILKTKQIYDSNATAGESTTASGESIRELDYNLCKDSDGTLRVYGDAVYETSEECNGGGWCNDNPSFSNSSYPFFGRGGCYYSASNAGVFTFDDVSGRDGGSHGFRPVICITSE